MRARYGFNEVEATLRHYVLNEPAEDLPLVTEGICLRYWNEIYIDPEAFSTLSGTGKLDQPKSYQLKVEDYGMRP